MVLVASVWKLKVKVMVPPEDKVCVGEGVVLANVAPEGP
jgi:hypothetical protein